MRKIFNVCVVMLLGLVGFQAMADRLDLNIVGATENPLPEEGGGGNAIV